MSAGPLKVLFGRQLSARYMRRVLEESGKDHKRRPFLLRHPFASKAYTFAASVDDAGTIVKTCCENILRTVPDPSLGWKAAHTNLYLVKKTEKMYTAQGSLERVVVESFGYKDYEPEKTVEEIVYDPPGRWFGKRAAR